MENLKKGTIALVSKARAFLYDVPEEEKKGPQTDDVLSGWALRLLENSREEWARVETHYGYRGWLRLNQIRPITEEELADRNRPGALRRVKARWADLCGEPSVKGEIRTSLPGGSFVSAPEETRDGWAYVRSAAGIAGWVYEEALDQRKEDDSFLLARDPGDRFFAEYAREKLRNADEDALREAAARTALSWLETPYRWGGKSPDGIDCSGLAFMTWMENGILIYRDARMLAEYPVREIPKEALRKGDLIFFPGHVAVYLGEGKYIHATAYRKTPRVTINSLNPEDPDYRQDLAEQVEACGSILSL